VIYILIKKTKVTIFGDEEEEEDDDDDDIEFDYLLFERISVKKYRRFK